MFDTLCIHINILYSALFIDYFVCVFFYYYLVIFIDNLLQPKTTKHSHMLIIKHEQISGGKKQVSC